MRTTFIALSALLTAAAIAQDSGVTEFAAKAPPLIESYQKDASGENAWPIVGNVALIVGAVIREKVTPDQVIDLDLISKPRPGEDAARQRALDGLKELEDR